MANVQISDLASAILPIDTINTFFELQTIEGGIQVSRKLSAQDLGIGGGVLSVNSGVNITVDNTDPQNPIINLDGSISGMTVNGVVLNDGGAATSYLDESGNYSVPAGSGGQVDSVVGGTNISVDAADPVNPIVNLPASISGMTVNSVVLTNAGVATNYLDETGNYSAPASGGGQVDSVVGGTNISVNAADPVNPIVNLDASISGMTVNGVVLTTGGVATNYLDETGAYSVPAGGGGGQVDSVVGGTNISVNAADPVNPIVNLDAAITGVSVNGVTLTTAGAATNYLDETGAYSAPPAGALPDPIIVGSINLTSALSTSTLGAPYINVPINVGANLVGTQGMTQISRQRIQTKPSAFSFNSNLFINVDGAGTSGSNTFIGGLNSANIEVEFGVAVRMQHGGSGLHVFETIGTGIYLEQGSCFIQEKATAEANTAGRGELWVRNDAPNVLVFTDDTGVDTVLGAGGGGISATPTPASGELAVWDSTGATLAGESELFYTGTTLRINNGLGGACLDLRDGNSTGSAAAVSLNLTDQVGTVIGQVGVALGITLLQCDAGQVSVVAGTGGIAKFTADALSFQLQEQSAPGLNTAGYGQWWVRDHVPNQPWFTDDADIDYPIGYGRPRFFTTNASYDMNTGANAENCINGEAYFDDGSPYTITLEDSTSTEFDVNTPFQIVNAGSGTITVAEGTGDTLFVLDGTAGTVTDAAGSATLGTGAVATVQRTAAGTWLIWGSGITP